MEKVLNRFRRFQFLIWIGVAAVFRCAAAETADLNKPAEGETRLQGSDADKALEGLAERFKANPRVKAHLASEAEDLVGVKKDEGEFLLDRGGRVLQKFGGLKPKLRLLTGTELHEYSASRKTDFIKDFAKAPNALKLLKSAVTVDLKELTQLFEINVYSKPAKTDGVDLRLVLLPRQAGNNPLAYQYIQARIGPKEPFFNEIEYMPDSGKIVERYSNMETVAAFADSDFAPPEGVKKEIDLVEGDGK